MLYTVITEYSFPFQDLQTKVDKLSDECEALRNSVEDESKQVKTLTNTICQLTRDKDLFGDEEVSEQEKVCSINNALSFACCCHCIWAVSYTHLDVYKRQI